MDVVRKAIAGTIFILILLIQLNPSLLNSAVVPDRGEDSKNSEQNDDYKFNTEKHHKKQHKF